MSDLTRPDDWDLPIQLPSLQPVRRILVPFDIILGRRGLTSELSGVPGAVERARASLSGGVAERVVRHAPTAVLVVD